MDWVHTMAALLHIHIKSIRNAQNDTKHPLAESQAVSGEHIIEKQIAALLFDLI